MPSKKDINMTATDSLKCDMYCLWEDLYDTYELCRKCIHNRNHMEIHVKNYRYDHPMMEDNNHLWRKKENLDYNEYKSWLERKQKVNELRLKVIK